MNLTNHPKRGILKDIEKITLLQMRENGIGQPGYRTSHWMQCGDDISHPRQATGRDQGEPPDKA